MLWVTRRGCHVDRTACVWLRGGPVLAEISEIVHDADLLDDKYGRPESYGLDAIIRGTQLVLPYDQALIRHTDAIFDGLYAYLSREVL